MQLKSYKELEVWKKSMMLVKETYKITESFPKNETYGLSSQMRRAAVSVPSNIAEGYKRQGLGEYLQFLSIADASAAEFETQLLIAKEVYTKIDFKVLEGLLLEIQKMLFVMLRNLKTKKLKP